MRSRTGQLAGSYLGLIEVKIYPSWGSNRLKDFRRIHTRYNKLAANFLSGVALAAAIALWL
jgi:transposase